MRTNQCGWAALASAALASLLTSHAAAQGAPQFTILPVRAAAVTMVSINNRDRRMTVGSRVQSNESGEGRLVGFALQDRFLDPIDFQDAGNILLTGHNDRGEIVGLLNQSDGTEFGFRYSLGKLNPIIIAGSSLPASPQDINNNGDVVGWVQFLSPISEPGFLLSGGQLTLIVPPDAQRNTGTRAWGINDKREIVGSYTAAGIGDRGFLFRNGAYTVIHVPDARATFPFDINKWGTIVGSYTDAAFDTHGFVLRAGRFTTIDIPNSVSTAVGSINDNGDIVGVFVTNTSVSRTFRSNVSEFIAQN